MFIDSIMTKLLNIMNSTDPSVPPIFWKVEDGNFYPADPRDVQQCVVCNKWFLNSNLLSSKNICTPGCNLAMIENLSKGKN